MDDSTRDRIIHLARVLQQMAPEEARRLLADLDEDIRLDREALRFLQLELLTPELIINELDDEALAIVLRPIDAAVLSSILERAEDSLGERLRKVLGKSRFEEAQNSTATEALLVRAAILDSLGAAYSRGSIEYNGLAFWILSPPCRPEIRAEVRQSLYFQTLNPFIRIGEGVALFIHAPRHPGRQVRVSFQADKERFFAKDHWFTGLRLDGAGVFFGEVFPLPTKGPVTVRVELSGVGEASRTVFFTEKTKARFSLHVVGMKYIDSILDMELAIQGLTLPPEEQALANAYCSRCGAPVATAFVTLSKNRGRVQFKLPVGENAHKHDLFLHLLVGAHQGQVRFNPFAPCDGRSTPSISSERKAGEAVSFDFSGEPGTQILFHVSTSESADRHMGFLMESGFQVPERRSSQKGIRKLTSLELDLFQGKLLLLGRAEKFSMPELIGLRTDMAVEYSPQGAENIQDLFFSFYRITTAGIIPFARHVSRLERTPVLWPDMPHFMEPGEAVQIQVAFRVPSGGELHIQNGQLEKKKLSGSGTLPLSLESEHPVQLNWKGPGNLLIAKTLVAQSRPITLRILRYVPPGSLLAPDAGWEILGSPKIFYEHILENTLLTYPWGCTEQTAAKIAGYFLLLLDKNTFAPDDVLVLHLKQGILKLLTGRGKSGLFSLFGEKPSVSASSMVFANLSLILPHRNTVEKHFPELLKIIDSLALLLKNQVKRSGYIFNPLSGTEETPGEMEHLAVLLSNSQHLIEYRNERFYSRGNSYESAFSICTRLAAALLRTGSSSLLVYGGKQKLQKLTYKPGLRGRLQKWGLLKPGEEYEEHIRKQELPDALPLLLKQTGYAHTTDGHPSTPEIRSLLELFGVIKDKQTVYEYGKADGSKLNITGRMRVTEPIHIRSPLTWAYQDVPLTPAPPGADSPIFRLSADRIRLEEVLSLHYHCGLDSSLVFKVLLPAVLGPIRTGDALINPQDLRYNPWEKKGVIQLKAIRRGYGPLRILVEKMYDPSQTQLLEVGYVTVE